MTNLAASEFILNPDGSIYHLNLHPQDLAPTVITVGDPERVEKVCKYFDKIELVKRKREFHTQTGILHGKRITVISTGIGTDNIDIVLNELDALVNIDFKTRKIKEKPKSLDIIRIGTSGAIQKEVPLDSFLLSEQAIGFDSLLHFYKRTEEEPELLGALKSHLNQEENKSFPYVSSCDESLAEKFISEDIKRGLTATNVGFYGPQGRVLRLPLQDEELNDKIESFEFRGKKITNLEMETAGIYGLAKLMGHRAVSLNAIVANRVTGKFSANPTGLVDELIKYALIKIAAEDF